MHYLFVIPLAGGILLLLFMKVIPNLSRLSLNLWNSAVAIMTAGMLFRGNAGYALLVRRSCLCGSGTTLHGLYSKCVEGRRGNQ